MISLQSASVEETEAFGEALGRVLQPLDFVGLSGEMGAGKTAFTRGVARGLGIPREAQVSSPTFAIVNAYRGGRLPLFHLDLYRVRDAEELYDGGLYELQQQGGAMIVEWISLVSAFAPADAITISLSGSDDRRTISVEARGAGQRLLEAWIAQIA